MNVHTNDPYQIIFNNFGETVILDAEILEPNRLRISIPLKNLKKLAEFVANRSFQFRGLFVYPLESRPVKRVEFQYIFERLYEKRSYQLLCCIQIEKKDSPVYIESISDIYPAAKLFEQKVSHDTSFIFLNQISGGGLTFESN